MRIFWALETNFSDCHVKIDGHDDEKTAFASHDVLYQFFVMPDELKTIPVTFQRAIDAIFCSVQWYSATIYIGDIVVF